MTLTELRYIVALAKNKHFGKAAISMHVSQPTLSVAINKLEKKLGVQIFERHHNRVSVTEIGKEIIDQALLVLEECEKITNIATQGKSQLASPLRIGAIFTVAPYLFPQLIPQIKKLAPDMPLIIDEDYTANLKTKLQMGALDVAIIALPFNAQGIVHRKIYNEPFVCLLRNDHSLAKMDKISNDDLTNQQVLLLGEGHCFRSQVIQFCPKYYGPASTAGNIEGTSLETLRHMVASGIGMTILPSTATQVKYYKDDLCTRPFKGKHLPSRDIAIAWRVSFPRPKVIDTIEKALSACNLEGVHLLSN